MFQRILEEISKSHFLKTFEKNILEDNVSGEGSKIVTHIPENFQEKRGLRETIVEITMEKSF